MKDSKVGQSSSDDTGIPHFLKVLIMALGFYQRPVLVAGFSQLKEIHRGLLLLRKKGKKRKEHSVLVL